MRAFGEQTRSGTFGSVRTPRLSACFCGQGKHKGK